MSEIYLAPLRIGDREAHKKRRRKRLCDEDDEMPDVEGRDGDSCPNCGKTRILSIPSRGAYRSGRHSIQSREWWRCCGISL